MSECLSVLGKLQRVQAELKVPKGQFNAHGKYRYRSCEDILESVKPLLKKFGAVVVVSDTIEMIGNRYYVMATARFMDDLTENFIEVKGYARECEDRKGMDASQITGATSSYARKYALNGLFCIDDIRDADSTNNGEASSDKKDVFTSSHNKWVSAIKRVREGVSIEKICQALNVSIDEDVKKQLLLEADNKDDLTPTHKAWQDALTKLVLGNTTLDKIKQQMNLSVSNEKLLVEQVKQNIGREG